MHRDVAEAASSTYRTPAADVVRMVDAPYLPRMVVSPRGRFAALLEQSPLPDIQRLAQGFLRLAGLRIDPLRNRLRTLGYYRRVTLTDLRSGAKWPLKLPPNARIDSFSWSPDGLHLALSVSVEDGVELWIAETSSGQCHRVEGLRLNGVLSAGYQWEPDGRHLICRVVIPDRRPPQSTEIRPAIYESDSKFARVRTYHDLLKSPEDEELFDHYAKCQLVRVDAVARQVTQGVGQPGIYGALLVAPAGQYLLVESIQRPYSYLVPYFRFARRIEIWDSHGQRVRVLEDQPLAEEIPIHGVRIGARIVAWRPLQGASLYWVEALDGGDPMREVPHRDRLMRWDAPFEDEPGEVARLTHRLTHFAWLPPDGEALISEFDRARRWRTTRHVNFDRPGDSGRVLWDLGVHDRYQSPGSPVLKRTPEGKAIALRDADWIYLLGDGATEEGDRPFLRRFHLETRETEELTRSDGSGYERVRCFVGDSRDRVVVHSETPTAAPSLSVRELTTGQEIRICHLEDPAPQWSRVERRIIHYERSDGLPLSGTLFLPPDYQPGQRLPVVITAYPVEYSDADTAGQVRSAPQRFMRPRGTSPLFFVQRGYAVLQNAQIPVMGDPDTMNDTYVDQVVQGAQAAVARLVELEVADPQRIGIIGHSYGATLAVNLLAHCDLFAAAIACSGAYNRTLTPFGFQAERRTLWEASQAYLAMSPIMHVEGIRRPLLLIHGEDDNNSGTHAIQSRRLYHALQGHGGTVRLVMLPHEGHTYRARQSILHVLVEMFDWFDQHLGGTGN
jgi:dipeptidyl aminopeptidase/acylaminoacyl peptidase